MDNKEKYRKILEKAYELEGLLLLAVQKERKPENIDWLIRQKFESLAAEFQPSSDPLSDIPPFDVFNKFQKKEDHFGDTFYALDDDEEEETENETPDSHEEEAEKSNEVAVDESPAVTKEEQCKKAAVSSRVKRRPLFSINDRFLFSKELFGNDIAAFDKEMEVILAFPSFREAEKYLLEERKMDPENETVSRFLLILEESFV